MNKTQIPHYEQRIVCPSVPLYHYITECGLICLLLNPLCLIFALMNSQRYRDEFCSQLYQFYCSQDFTRIANNGIGPHFSLFEESWVLINIKIHTLSTNVWVLICLPFPIHEVSLTVCHVQVLKLPDSFFISQPIIHQKTEDYSFVHSNGQHILFIATFPIAPTTMLKLHNLHPETYYSFLTFKEFDTDTVLNL